MGELTLLCFHTAGLSLRDFSERYCVIIGLKGDIKRDGFTDS
jgi:hypothetical protein